MNNDNEDKENLINEDINILDKIINLEIIKEEEYITKLEKLKDKYFNSKIPENIVRSAILNYLINENKNIKDLKKELLKNFKKNEIINIILDVLKITFKDPSPFRAILSFGDDIPLEKKYIECYFKLILLTYNAKIIIEAINKVLEIKKDDVEFIIKKINFKNPYSILFLRDLIINLILKNKEISTDLIIQKTKDNMKMYNILRCSECFLINYVFIKDNDITIICPNKHVSILKNIQDLKTITQFEIKCSNCLNIIKVYEENYKCITCQKLFCEYCSKKHDKENLECILLNIYKIGFYCEEHYNKYYTFCGFCKKNLCGKCVETHFHKIDKNNSYKLTKKKKKTNIKLNDIENPKEYIKKGLFFIYNFMNDFSFFNIFIKLSLWFNEKEDRIDKNNQLDYYFENFFDKNFQEYYSILIEKVKNGNKTEIFILKEIKSKYKELSIPIDKEYYNFKNNFKKNKASNNRIIYFNQRYKEYINEIDLYIDRLNNNTNNFEIKKKNQKYKADINILKLEIISLFNTNNQYLKYLEKLINGYISDYIIRQLIKNYPYNFKKVELNLKNAYEIMINYPDIDKKKIVKSIKDIISNNNNNHDEIEIDQLKDKNKLEFNHIITIKNENFNIKELNFLLNILFYLKSQGNIIAHPNILPSESIKIKLLKKFNLTDTFNINNNKDNNIINNNKNNNNNKSKEIYQIIDDIMVQQIKNEVITQMKLLKEKIIKEFSEIINNNKIDINSIINCIFYKKFESIFSTNSAFLRGLSINIDNIIEKDLIFNLKNNIIEKIINRLEIYLNSDDNIEKEYYKLKIDINDHIFGKIKNFVTEKFNKEISKDSNSGISSINNFYKSFFFELSNLIRKNIINNSDDKDIIIEAIILLILIPQIKEIELNNLDIIKKNTKSIVKNYLILYNIKKQLKKILLKIKEYNENNNNNEENLIYNVKNYIKNKFGEEINIEIDLDRITYMIKNLISEKEFDWFKLIEKENVSLISYLYFMQNK